MTKVAVVTGGNKGIGLAIVRGLAKVFEGDVYLTARDVGRGQKAVQELEAEGAKVLFHQLDISNEESIENLKKTLEEKYDGLDVLINNAGIAFKNNATEPMSHQAKITIATNYFAVKKTCEILFPLLKKGSRVVNVSSSSGYLKRIPSAELRKQFSSNELTTSQLDQLMEAFIKATEAGNHKEEGWPNSTYSVSKVGLSALTRIQQREMDLEDVAINHVHPGYVDTDMTSHKGPLTPDQGAKSSIFAATLPPNTEVKGQYIWEDCSILDWTQ